MSHVLVVIVCILLHRCKHVVPELKWVARPTTGNLVVIENLIIETPNSVLSQEGFIIVCYSEIK